MELLNQLKYSTYVIFHPFKGFWDLKHDKKGSLKASFIFISIICFVYILKLRFTAFLFNMDYNKPINVSSIVIGIVITCALWVVVNWGVTTLVDGKGTMKDIAITTGYAITPIIFINIPLIFISQIISLQEGSVYSFFYGVSLIWSGVLLFLGIMTIHQFTVSKTIITILIVILGMLAVIFLSLMFFTIGQQFYNFFYLLLNEMSLRI